MSQRSHAWIDYELRCAADAIREHRYEDAHACQNRALMHYNDIDLPYHAYELYDHVVHDDCGDEEDVTVAIVDAKTEGEAMLLFRERLGIVCSGLRVRTHQRNKPTDSNAAESSN